MNHRTLGRTGISVSEVGFGLEWLQGKDYATVKSTIDEAIKLGINIFDVFMSEPQVRSDIGKALQGQREKVIIQGHIGATWKDGQYARSRNIGEVKAAFDDLLERLGTDYIDIGMLHFVDTMEDFKEVFEGEVIEYVKELKAKGVIKTIGLSSHITPVAKKAVETDLIDVLMFSLNPAIDILPGDILSLDDVFKDEVMKGQRQRKLDEQRMSLYHACEKHGTAITVMKAYMAGRLLDAEKSPFGQALTTTQCIHFSLTRPAVASALIGCKTPEELRQAAAYETASAAERDFSEIFTGEAAFEANGQCVYCNHCLPCPARIDIAQVNQYLDLAKAAEKIPPTVREHYNALPSKASACMQCGDCVPRCPFDVPIREKMKEAAKLFS